MVLLLLSSTVADLWKQDVSLKAINMVKKLVSACCGVFVAIFELLAAKTIVFSRLLEPLSALFV